jgi:hypothetical protein
MDFVLIMKIRVSYKILQLLESIYFVAFLTRVLFCYPNYFFECCEMRLSASSAAGVYKEKVRAKKNEFRNDVKAVVQPQYHKYRNPVPFSGKCIK